MNRYGLFAVSITFLVVLGSVSARVYRDLHVTQKPVEVTISAPQAGLGRDVRLAIIGDLHIGFGVVDMDVVQRLFEDVEAAQPDAILLTGDFMDASARDFETLRAQVAEALHRQAVRTPLFLVFGNHDTFRNSDGLQKTFQEAGLNALENQLVQTDLAGIPTCVKGLGDYYSGHFRDLAWPSSCANSLKITLTHDPAAAFLRPFEGIVFSGHTHCGQVVLPFIGAPWVPTRAPQNGQCGLFQDAMRTLYVTSGVGTSIVPVRFFAPSQWELVTLRLR